MKKIVLLSVFLLALNLTAQTPRYYPSLKNLFSESHDKQMPTHFNYFDTWLKNLTQAVFYKDLQHSTSSKGDASFQSMGLIFKKQNTFKIGNSGFEIIVNKDKPDFSVPVNIQMEQKFRILAYFRSFDPNSYDPKNLKHKYELGLMIFNLSEEQVLAEFLNRYVSESKDNKTTAIQQLINDLKKEAKVKVVVDEKNDKQLLKKIVTQVYEQTQKYCSSVLYDIYIKTKDQKKEAQNFAGFFRKYSPDNASDYIDETVSYEATIAIPKTEISLLIPKEILEVFTIDEKNSTSTPIENKFEIQPRQIEMKTINTIKNKCVQFTLTPSKINSKASFKILNEIKLNKHPFLKPDQRKLNTFKVADIQKLIFSVAENEITVEVIIKNDNWDVSYVIMKQGFNLN